MKRLSLQNMGRDEEEESKSIIDEIFPRLSKHTSYMYGNRTTHQTDNAEKDNP